MEITTITLYHSDTTTRTPSYPSVFVDDIKFFFKTFSINTIYKASTMYNKSPVWVRDKQDFTHNYIYQFTRKISIQSQNVILPGIDIDNLDLLVW